jgi:hypothetical protein
MLMVFNCDFQVDYGRRFVRSKKMAFLWLLIGLGASLGAAAPMHDPLQASALFAQFKAKYVPHAWSKSMACPDQKPQVQQELHQCR